VRAVVLVGGFGTRLRPLTLNIPKQMLPIVGKPMIEHVVEYLSGHGVTEVILSLGFAPDVFQSAYPDGYCNGVPIHYAIEPEPLDTAGAVRFAAESAGITGTFLVTNGDVLTDLNVKELVSFHKESEAEASLHLIPVEDPSQYGVVDVRVGGMVSGFIEKPETMSSSTSWVNAGTYVFETSVLDRIKPNARVSLEREVFPSLAASSSLFAFQSEDYWIDTGIPSTYLQAQLDLITGGVRGFTGKGISPSAVIAGEVQNSVIGNNVVVEKGASVHRSVLLDGALVRENVLVSDSIIGFDAEVGQGSTIESFSIVGHSVKVPPETEANSMKLER